MSTFCREGSGSHLCGHLPINQPVSSLPLFPRELTCLSPWLCFPDSERDSRGSPVGTCTPAWQRSGPLVGEGTGGLREENESLTAMLCSKEEELHRTKATMNAVREERDCCGGGCERCPWRGRPGPAGRLLEPRRLRVRGISPL